MPTRESDFALSMDWLDLGDSPPEEAATSGLLKIRLKDRYASRHFDLSSKTVVDYAKVSAYPMALWAAYYWWRLNYEPLISRQSYYWKSAHDLPAAGCGYVWPPLRIVSGGETVSLIIMPSANAETMADVQYDSATWGMTMPQVQFESRLSDFINMIVARLHDAGRRETELQALWRDVCCERQNEDNAFYRILEACLGHNPDEGPEYLINKLADHAAAAGRQAIIEMAVGMSGEVADKNNINSLGDILEFSGQGLLGRFNYGGFEPAVAADQRSDKPWAAGHGLARALRRRLGLDGRPICDRKMAELFELSADDISSDKVVEPLKRVNMSLGLPAENERVRLCLHHPHRLARRFYLSRLLGEHLLNANSPATGNWLPATFGETWRQKYQRAFASEFLCPIEALKERFGSDVFYDEYEMERIAEDYGLGTLAVRKHWDYNRPQTMDIFEDQYAR
jgi:hypothetical protein